MCATRRHFVLNVSCTEETIVTLHKTHYRTYYSISFYSAIYIKYVAPLSSEKAFKEKFVGLVWKSETFEKTTSTIELKEAADCSIKRGNINQWFYKHSNGQLWTI